MSTNPKCTQFIIYKRPPKKLSIDNIFYFSINLFLNWNSILFKLILFNFLSFSFKFSKNVCVSIRLLIFRHIIWYGFTHHHYKIQWSLDLINLFVKYILYMLVVWIFGKSNGKTHAVWFPWRKYAPLSKTIIDMESISHLHSMNLLTISIWINSKFYILKQQIESTLKGTGRSVFILCFVRKST